MGTITKTTTDEKRLFLAKEAFGAPRSVQGGILCEHGDVKRVESPKRFKLFSEGALLVRIETGSGFIKWKRGEFPFGAQDVLRVEGAGEFELNGACTFLYCNE